MKREREGKSKRVKRKERGREGKREGKSITLYWHTIIIMMIILILKL